MDTGAFLALARSSDPNHKDAKQCLDRIAALRLPLFVSLPTIYEAHRRFLFDLGAPAASRFLAKVFDGSTNIVRTTSEDETEAQRLTSRYPDLTLTDAVNMAVMVRLEIGACFSFDWHFLQVGFLRVPPLYL
jgi:predicted nucleic acid-binding protein